MFPLLKNPWLAWYPGDYLSKTRYLTMAQHGAYLLLLWEYYINGPIPAHAEQVFNICSAHDSQNQSDVQFVLSRFFTQKRDKYHHKRADEEIVRREDIRNKRVKAGKARQHMLSTSPAHVEQMTPQSQSQSQRPKTGVEGFNPQEAAIIVAKAKAWADHELIWALQSAIEAYSTELKRADFVICGEELVAKWPIYQENMRRRREMPGSVKTFFQQAKWREVCAKKPPPMRSALEEKQRQEREARAAMPGNWD